MTKPVLQFVLLLAAGLAASPPLCAQAPPLSPAPSLALQCRVIGITDGDTITVEIPIRVKVRLMDIEAPELRGSTQEEKDAARASLANLEKLALNQPATLYVPLAGRPTIGHLFSFERLVAKAFVHGEDLGERQIADGHARRAGK